LFELHLITQEHKVLGASSHRNSVGQGNLSGFIDEQEIKCTFPFRPGKEPGRSPYYATGVSLVRLTSVLDVLHTGMAHKQGILRVTTDFHAVELNVAFFGGVAAGGKKIHHGLVAVGCDTDFLPGSEKRRDDL
jgi:hypothetical protein